MLLLDKLEEGRHVWPAEMIDCFQTSEHRPAAQPLEMVFTNVEHGGSQVKFVEELSYKDVHLQHVGHVPLLNISQHVYEPLKISMGGANPQEVDFLACHARISIC